MLNFFLKDESGLGTVEILLIITVLVGLVVIFRNRIRELVESIWSSINDSASSIYS